MKKRIFAGLIAITMAASAIPNVLAEDETTTQTAEQIHELYDKVEASNDCETAVEGTTLSTDTSWDGTKYLKTGDSRAVIAEIDANTDEEYMWEADVRFDESMSGIAIASKSADLAANNNYGVRIIRNDTRPLILWRWRNTREQVQTGITVGENAWNSWYHIQIIGRHGLDGGWASQLVKVTKWDGEKWVWVGEETVGVASNSKVARIVADAHTSIDNAKIVKLGADKLTLSTSPADVTELSAGSGAQMLFKATRNNRDIAAPTVTWKVFEKGGDEISDGTVEIDENGKLTASKECTTKTVTVKAVSTVNEKELIGEYDIKINAVSWTDKKYDTLSLNAGDEVRAGGSLALTVTAKMDSVNVTDLADSDVVWKVYDETYTQEIGNNNIYVENGELVVDEKVISQKINLLAQDAAGDVKSNVLPITIKAADAVDIGDEGVGEKILLADAGEDISSPLITAGSWDGSHYYYWDGTAGDYTSANNKFYSKTVSTTGGQDLVIDMDVQFKADGSGFSLGQDGEGAGKSGGAWGNTTGVIKRETDSISNETSKDKFATVTECDGDAWYHVQLLVRCGSDDSYGKLFIYKYNGSGELVNPTDAESTAPAAANIWMRNLASKLFQYIRFNPGTCYDNLRVTTLVPDEINLTLSSETIFAGAKATATYTVLRKGVEIPSYPSAKILWGSSDSTNVTIANGGIETNTLMDEKTVTIYAVLDGNSTVRGTAELSVIGNDMFTITGFGLAENNDNQISELRVRKNFFYSGDVVFIVALYDTDGALIQVAVRTLHDNTLGVGENGISIDPIDLPEDFGSVKAMVWTSLN